MIPFGMAGRLGGIQIWDWSDPWVQERACELQPLLCDLNLRFDEIYVSYSTQSILVGEQAHYLYRLHQTALNNELRERVQQMFREAELRILGETLESVTPSQ